PSLAKLTHHDRFPWSVWPAQLRLRATQEPVVQIGSGKVTGGPAMPVLDEPLLSLLLPGLAIGFAGIGEGRWVHLMTVTADIHVPLGIYATPSNEIQLLFGDLRMGISNVHVSKSDILEESSTDLETSVPSLVQLVLPQITGRLAPQFRIPDP